MREALGAARHDRRARRVPVPRQGAMKQVLDARRHPHAAPRPRHDRGRGARGGRAHRLPARSSSRSPAPARPTPTASTTRGELEQALPQRSGTCRGERRGVHRRRGVHLRHRLRRRQDPVREHLPGTGRGRSSRAQHEWISPQTVALRDLDRPGPRGRRARWAATVLEGARLRDRLHPHGVVPQARRRGGLRRDRRAGRRARAPST